MEDVKDAAEKYENAFNDIISSVTNTENFKQVSDTNISEMKPDKLR